MSSPDTGGSGGGAAWDRLLAAAIAVQVAPVLLCVPPPSQDGPAHVGGAWALLRLGNPDAPVYADWYVENPSRAGNLVVHWLLGGLLSWLPPAAAETAIPLMLLVGTPLAARYALSGCADRARALAILTVPLSASYLLWLGFWNFLAGSALGLVAVGAGWRAFRLRAARHALTALAAFGFAWAAHPLAFLLAGAALAVPIVGALGRRGFAAATAALVVAAIAIVAFSDRQGGAVRSVVEPDARLLHLLRADVLAVFGPWERPAAIVVTATALAAWLLSLRRPPRWSPFVLLPPTFLALYFAAPDLVGEGSFIHLRTMWWSIAVLVLAAGARSEALSDRALGALRGAAFAATFALAALRVGPLRALQGAQADLEAVADDIPRGTIGVYLALSEPLPDGPPSFPRRILPMSHAGNRLAPLRDVVVLPDYEARTGQFPLIFRRTPSRDALLADLDATPPQLSPALLEEHGIAWLLRWGGDAEAEPPPGFERCSTSGRARLECRTR